MEAREYEKLVKALRERARREDEYYEHGGDVINDAAAAIEAMNRLVDLNTQRCEALRKQLREAHESYEMHLNEFEAEVKRLQKKLCDWCAVCPKERRKAEDCELLGENPVMYGPSGAKMEVQDA